MADFDVAAARSKFPALQEDQVFLDNAGGSQTLGTVIEAISDYLIKSNVQFGGGYRTSQLSSSRYNAGVEAGAKFLNARKDEIAFASSATQIFRNLSLTFQFNSGDELILSSIDHEANIAAWKDLASRQRLVIRWWRPQPNTTNPILTPESLKPLLSPKTRLVACTHASNVLGTIHDIAAITAIVHSTVPGALVCVDGVAYAPHRPVDVKQLGVDFYVLSWYKVYGPHVAMLYGSRRAQEGGRMRSLGHFFNPSETLGDKVGLGSTNYELVASLPAITAYLTPPTWSSILSHESLLQTTLLTHLLSHPTRFTIFGTPDPDPLRRLPTISFGVAGWDSRELVEEIEREAPRYGVRWGAFYSYGLVREEVGLGGLGLGEGGVVRVSLVHYNTLDEVNGFIEALEDVIAKKT